MRKGEQLTLAFVIATIADSLISDPVTPNQRKRGRPSLDSNADESPRSARKPRKAPDLKDTPDGIRFDEKNHLPIYRSDHPRCKVCKEKTRNGCQKCGKGLCITESRNCFLAYHESH